MCTVVLLRRPDHRWPLIVAANRDEMMGRPWKAPGRHWPDRTEVVAGLDVEAGGSWLGINDHGVVAAVLNRMGSLGPAAGKRSRGELVLDALDHADAADAAAALAALNAPAFRTFNLVIADNRDAYWLAWRGPGNGDRIEVAEIPDGLHMLTAYDMDDESSARIRAHRPRFLEASPPDPDGDDWAGWEAILASRQGRSDDQDEGAMTVTTESGFGTVSSALIALPAASEADLRPRFRFAPGRPDEVPFEDVFVEQTVA